MKEHKHKWYKTTLVNNKNQNSYACECGCWKVEYTSDCEIELVNFNKSPTSPRQRLGGK